MPSGMPTYWSNHGDHNISTLPTSSPSNFNWEHENHKRHHGMPSGMPSGLPSEAPTHWSNHHAPTSVSPSSISPQNYENHRRHESIPPGAPSYWKNHDNHKPTTPSISPSSNQRMGRTRSHPQLHASRPSLRRGNGMRGKGDEMLCWENLLWRVCLFGFGDVVERLRRLGGMKLLL